MPFRWMIGLDHMESITEAGVHEKSLVSVDGCDSLYYILNLEVLESLVVEMDEWPKEICADDELFEVGYEVSTGKVSGYSILFSEKSKRAGFEDVVVEVDGEDNNIVVDLPKGIRPNTYDAKIIFDNMECGNVEMAFVFDVYYPSDIITQRWNDVLALKNEEYNGGYEFVKYQWFLDGHPLDGFNASQLYKEGHNLKFDGEYQVLVTRVDDGVSMMTCSFVPTQYSEEELEDMGVLIFTRETTISVDLPQSARCCIYNMSGVLCCELDLSEGDNEIDIPCESGIYIVRFNYNNGGVDVRKMIVTK
jgi:hypothetical protein